MSALLLAAPSPESLDARFRSHGNVLPGGGPLVPEPPVGCGTNWIWNTDALTLLRALPDNTVNCIVTSPPYFGLRDYGVPGQIGLEPTPQQFVATMVAVFRECRRVLRDDGVCWLNLGDSYATNPGNGRGGETVDGGTPYHSGSDKTHAGLKPKDLMMIPARVAIALQDDGWYLRSEIVWHKPNPMPESVTDRPTKAHEMVYLLTKSPTYWYDTDAVREAVVREWDASNGGTMAKPNFEAALSGKVHQGNNHRGDYPLPNPAGRNRRSVWTVATEPTPFAHFATFPRKLIEPMILAGCPDRVCSVCGAPWERAIEREAHYERRQFRSQPNGVPSQVDSSGWRPATVTDHGFRPTCEHADSPTRPGITLDPFMGSGTTALVARSLGRDYLGCDLNPEYVNLARERLRLPFEDHHVAQVTRYDDLPLFAAALDPGA